MQIHAIYFDAVGTLIHPEPSAAVVYAEVGRRHGSRLGRDAIRKRFGAAFARQEQIDRAAGWRTSEARERERWRSIVGEVLDDVADPAACFAELYEHFARPDAWRCAPETGRVLSELRRRGHVLGLASNYDHRLHTVRAGFDALRGIDNVLVSAEVGWRKPAARFFEAMGRQAAVEANAVLHVGDDVDCDYAGAIAAGMNAVLLDPQPPAGVRAVSRLEALLDF